MIIIEYTYTVFDLWGGPFHGCRCIESATLPVQDAFYGGDNGFVHVYTPIGASLFYKGSHKRVQFTRPTTNEVSCM